jgi:PleD family two-component response regulator
MTKVLIIDDDISFLSSMELVLSSKNFEIVKTSNWKHCFDILSNEKPDIILLDINLLDINGFKLLKSIKMSKEFSDLPIIIITSYSTLYVDKAFSEGADDCVFKPPNIDELIDKIKKLVK